MAYATGRCMCHAHLRLPFEEEDVVAMVRKVFAGRVTFHDGASQVAPGVTVHKIGGHSKGLQCVQREDQARHRRARLRRDPPLCPHRGRPRVSRSPTMWARCWTATTTIKKLAPSPKHIVPGHDPLVLERYPAARPGLEGWVARLDVDPKSPEWARAA